MKDFKQHIALLLFAGFAFPQIANSVHYFVVSHYNYPDEHNSRQFATPAYDYHKCDYHLTGFNLILTPNNLPVLQVRFFEKIQPINYEFGHEIAFAFNYRLRGPPNESTSV